MCFGRRAAEMLPLIQGKQIGGVKEAMQPFLS